MRSAVLLMILAFADACSATQRPKQTQTAASPPDDRACRVGRGTNESAECFAVRCAEDFVRRNGYTLDAATGPVVRESVYSPTVDERKGMLERVAVGYRSYPPGHLVVFRYSSSTGKTGRAVTMSGEFGDLRVAHQEFFLSAAPSIPACPLCQRE